MNLKNIKIIALGSLLFFLPITAQAVFCGYRIYNKNSIPKTVSLKPIMGSDGLETEPMKSFSVDFDSKKIIFDPSGTSAVKIQFSPVDSIEPQSGFLSVADPARDNLSLFR